MQDPVCHIRQLFAHHRLLDDFFNGSPFLGHRNGIGDDDDFLGTCGLLFRQRMVDLVPRLAHIAARTPPLPQRLLTLAGTAGQSGWPLIPDIPPPLVRAEQA